jgi:NADH dehydrogenase FAD-containing subunit
MTQSILFLDTGASKLIADGKIKLKTDSIIKSFTETSIVFENGTELAADVVVFATGWVVSLFPVIRMKDLLLSQNL